MTKKIYDIFISYEQCKKFVKNMSSTWAGKLIKSYLPISQKLLFISKDACSWASKFSHLAKKLPAFTFAGRHAAISDTAYQISFKND